MSTSKCTRVHEYTSTEYFSPMSDLHTDAEVHLPVSVSIQFLAPLDIDPTLADALKNTPVVFMKSLSIFSVDKLIS